MNPALKSGDILFFRNYIKHKTSLITDQIVIFNHPLKNVRLVKRIKFVSNNSIQVIGDNKKFSEDSNSFGFVSNDKIIGIVTSKLTNLKFKNFLSQKKNSTFLNPE
tara:strand:+ start:103 stop:420 length:318 start_codon:yes stop_codon:yes gene_type:complete